MTAFACLLCAYLIAQLPGGREPEPYAFAAGAEIDVDAARAAYGESGGDAELYALLLGLCRQAYTGGEAAETADLGRELYARAKAGKIDLETIGDPADTAAMLALLREMGVTLYSF